MNAKSNIIAPLNYRNFNIYQSMKNKLVASMMMLPVILFLLVNFLVYGEASAASMTFTSDTTITSDETIDEGEVWAINEDVTLTIAEGVIVTNNGAIKGPGQITNLGDLINDGTMGRNAEFILNNSGTFTNNGHFGAHNDVTIFNDGDVINNGTIFSEEEGSYENEGSFKNNGIVDLNDNSQFINTTGTFINNNELRISGTTFENNNTFINEGTVNIIGDGIFENNNTFINEGTVNITDGSILANKGTVKNKGTIFKSCEGLITPNVPTSGNAVENEEGCAPFEVETRVTSQDDDGEERMFGTVSFKSADLELVRVANEGEGGDQTVGLRFCRLKIPQGATILNAYVQFTADETGSEATSLTIRGEASDDAQKFSQSDFNISSRPLTTASVAWFPAPWTVVGDAGSAQRTPDIAPVIQEIVNRPGWSHDRDNYLAIIITGEGKRTADSYSFNRRDKAPLLHIEFTTGSNQSPIVNINGPSDGTNFSEDDTVTFTGAATDEEDGDLAAELNWESDRDGVLGAGASFSRSDLSVGTHTITASVTDSGGSPGSDTTTITVNIDGNPTLEVQVTAREDDAEERMDGNGTIASADLELGKVANEGIGGDQTVGLRFSGISIPQGTTILNAYVQFTADETRSEPTFLTIHGEASDDAEEFSQSDFNISSRPQTIASVAWSPAPWTGVGDAGSAQQTSDMTSVIQEIVDQPGWSDGNSLAIIITGEGKRTADSYGENRAEAAPLLHIEYLAN